MTLADYIEDPQIAASIDDLKRRWPDIGAAADHPLTEFFLTRKITRSRILNRTRERIAYFLAAILIYCVLWYFFPRFLHHFSGATLLAVFTTVSILSRYSKMETEYNLRNPDQLLNGAGDESQWQQIWLVPLSYRDIAGVNLGCAFHTWRMNAVRDKRIIIAIGILTFAVCVYYLCSSFNMWVFVPCLLFLLYFGLQTVSSAPAFLRRRMDLLQITLSRGKKETNSGLRSNLDSVDVLLVLLIALNVFLLSFFGNKGIFVDASMLLWGCIFFYRTYCYRISDLDTSFKMLLESEADRYEEMIRGILKLDAK